MTDRLEAPLRRERPGATRIGRPHAAAAALTVALTLPASATAEVPRYGHGIGLSQVGAQNRARLGHGATQILNFYYPGSRPVSVPPTKVRVRFYDRPVVRIRTSPRFPRGVTVSVRRGRMAFGRKRLPYAAAIVRGPVCLRRCYRGHLVIRLVGGRLRVVNHVAMEDYLRSVVPSEMPWTWNHEALRAQAVAARSYALYAIQASRRRDWDVWQDTRSQAYWGMEQETSRTDAAVASTRGRVRVHGRRVILAMYTAANGGRTVAFPGIPYLPSRRDRFD